MIDLNAHLTIGCLGQRGEGFASFNGVPVFVPFAVPGDRIVAEVDGGQGKLVEVLEAGPDRVPPICRWFTICGGCATQTVSQSAQLEWKRGLVIGALSHAGVSSDVGKTIDAHGTGRRRAAFHARADARNRMHVGFMAARSHDIVEIDACPLFAPGLAQALPAARAAADALSDLGKPLDIVVTQTQEGLDLDIRGPGLLDEPHNASLARVAGAFDLARISNHGRALLTRKSPRISMGRATVVLPPGAFLQATEAGERALAEIVAAAAKGARKTADLFSGVGTFALRLAEHCEVFAVENDPASTAASVAAARATPGLRSFRAETRDLFKRPLLADELGDFDCVVFDPPRAGAMMQAQTLAASSVQTVVAISCNVQSFARDAKILLDGGYAIESVTPVDQFRHSAHVEIVGVFRRAVKKKAKRSLLG